VSTRGLLRWREPVPTAVWVLRDLAFLLIPVSLVFEVVDGLRVASPVLIVSFLLNIAATVVKANKEYPAHKS
jgi:flagellar biosynthesis protein FliR